MEPEFQLFGDSQPAVACSCVHAVSGFSSLDGKTVALFRPVCRRGDRCFRYITLPSGAFQQLSGRYIQAAVCLYTQHPVVGTHQPGYPYVEHFQTLWLLWMIQGAAFAVVLMATGSTLVIDVTPSQKRNQANVCFTWAGIFGMIAGLMGGYHAETLLTFPQLTYCSAFLSVGAILLISMVTVTFRAPLELPLLSFDRFILFRSLGPGLNMMAVPFVLGMILSTIYDSFFYLCIGGGFICFLFLKAATVTRADGRLLVTIGQLLTGAGLLVLYYSDAGIHLWGAGFLIGLGAAASISQFLFVMIQLPLHCERGTGYHTYQLLWELGILLGVMSGKWTAATPSGNPFIVALVVCLVGLIAYQLAVHRYYRKQMERRKI